MTRLIKRVGFLVFYLLVFTTACERDDICLGGTPGTPQLIVKFFDATNPSEIKVPSESYVRAINNTDTLRIQMADSVILPLDTTKAFSTFEFISNFNTELENIDTLQFHYSRFDQYINRSCGFKAAFVFDGASVQLVNPGNDWIVSHSILKDTIADETEAHLAIFH